MIYQLRLRPMCSAAKGIIIVGPGSMRRPKSSQKTGVDQELQRVMGQGECLMRDNP